MASTTFAYGTLITSAWLNDVNNGIYNTIPTLAPLISPHFTTPVLGVAAATSINKNTFSTPATNCTWTLADGKTFTINNTITLSGTDGATLNIGGGGTLTPAIYNTTGTNTGDQNVFKTIAVSGQTSVVAGNTADTLTLAAGTGIGITTSGSTVTVASTSASPGLVLLSTATVSTAVANIDFLSTFTSTYDKYLVEITGIKTGTADTMALRTAVAGAAQNTTAYAYGTADGSTGTNATEFAIAPTVAVNSSYGMAITLEFRNTQATGAGIKSIGARGLFHNNAGSIVPVIREGQFNGSGVLSGFRLFFTGGATFTAGTVRVYGVRAN